MSDTDVSNTKDEGVASAVPDPIFVGEGGLYIVIGGGGSGKSKFLTEHCHTIVYAGEPDHRAVSLDRGLNALYELGWASRFDNFDPEGNVVGFDSFKDLTYNSGGAALSDGINSGMFVSLSNLSAYLMQSRVRVVASLNPTQDKLVEQMYQLLLSNVTGVAELRDGKISRSHERIWNPSGYYDRVDGDSFSFLKSSTNGHQVHARRDQVLTTQASGHTGATVARHILERVNAESEFITLNNNEV